MKKHILIKGAPSSGRSTMAAKIAATYAQDEFVLIGNSGKLDLHAFMFSSCDENTKLIVIDEVYLFTDLVGIIGLITAEQIVVHKQCKRPFLISPRFVIVANELEEAKDKNTCWNAVKNKFEIIQTQKRAITMAIVKTKIK